jgi:hypothetical protein
MKQQIQAALSHACRAAPAVLAFRIVSPITLAATGDLDTGFADIGGGSTPDALRLRMKMPNPVLAIRLRH